jgi:Ca2+-binding RTX toxin-like protein
MDTTPVISSADPTYTCDYQGISAGWADWYESTLPGQYIVIDGLRNGNYRLQVTTDYKNYFQEGNEKDNTISIGLNIKDNEATWIGPFWEPDVRIGGNGDDTLIADLDRVADFWGGGGNDMLTGSGLADKLRGEKGNDTVSGLAGDDELDGGEGHDTAVFHSDFSEYTFAFTDAGIIVTDKISDGDGSDTLRSIEAARFADRTVSLVNTIHEKPVLSKTSFKEDILVDTILAKVSAQDEEGDQLTYTLTDNAGGYFRLSGQHLLLSKELDHETLPQHTITIAAMDKFGRTISETYTIDVADVTEPVGPGTPPDNGGGTTPGGGTPVDGIA